MPGRLGPAPSPAPAVTLVRSPCPSLPTARKGFLDMPAPWQCHRTELGCPRSQSARQISPCGDSRGRGQGGQGLGTYVSLDAPALLLPGTWHADLDGAGQSGCCPLSPSPVPCPPPAVQPRGLPSHRRVSQLSFTASEQRRVLDKALDGRGGLAGVESPRGGKTRGGNKTSVLTGLCRGMGARGGLTTPAPALCWGCSRLWEGSPGPGSGQMPGLWGGLHPHWRDTLGPSWHTTGAAQPGQLDEQPLGGDGWGTLGQLPGVAATPPPSTVTFPPTGVRTRAASPQAVGPFEVQPLGCWDMDPPLLLPARPHLLRDQSRASSSICGVALTCHSLLAPLACLSLPPGLWVPTPGISGGVAWYFCTATPRH